MAGSIVGIYVAETASAPMVALDSVLAIAGKGLEGDRYASGTGFYSPNPTTPGAREITLIDEKAVADVGKAVGARFDFASTRRNLVTRDVELGTLLGKRFRIGAVVCEGVRDCPPCIHLEELTGLNVMKSMLRIGGLRARIVTGGDIAVGNEISEIGDATGVFDTGE